MFDFVISMLAVFAVAVAYWKIGLTKWADQKVEEEERRREEERKTLRYVANPLVESILTGDETVNYTGFIRGLRENGYAPDKMVEPLEKLKKQEMRMNHLFSEIDELLSKIEIEKSECIYAAVQRCLDVYSANRDDFVDAVDDMQRAVLERNRKQYAEKIIDIAKDNQQILLAMERFYDAIAAYLAKANQDETAVHITDFNAVVELDKLTEAFEKVVQETEEEIKSGIEEQMTQSDGEHLTLQAGGGH